MSVDAAGGPPRALVPGEGVDVPPLVIDDAAEGPEPVAEEASTLLPAQGEDLVRLYFKEIGKVPLLPAQQEVEIGRRIEVGQIALRRALARWP